MKTSIAFIFLCLHFYIVDAHYISLPLKRHKSSNHLRIEKRLSNKFPRLNKPKPTPPFDNDTIALYKYQDSEIFAHIGIGSPAQQFKLVLDTTWADTWVLSVLCSTIHPACQGNVHNKYDSHASSTFIYNGTEYDYGHAYKGFVSVDRVTIGHLTVRNQVFAEITDVPDDFAMIKADGIIGLAFATLSNIKMTTVFNNIFQQNLIKNPLFSIYINNDKTTEHGGSICIGGYEPRHFFNDTLHFVPLNKTLGYWQFQMDRIVFNNTDKSYPFCNNGCQAAIDTSTAIITGPPNEIKVINRLLRATKFVNNRYQIPCNKVNKLPHMLFTINNRTYEFKGKELIQRVVKTNFTICLSPFTDGSDIWFLGTKFLEKVFLIFDIQKSRMGFAKSINYK